MKTRPGWFGRERNSAQPSMTLERVVSWRLVFPPLFVIAGLFLLVLQVPLFLLFLSLCFLAYVLWLIIP